MTSTSSPLGQPEALSSALFPRTVYLAGNDPEATRREIEACFTATFDRYESLFTTLASEQAYLRKSISLRHPLIFYLGHTATFFVNKLVLAKLLPARIDPNMESIFAVGVDEMSWDDLNEAHYSWPSVSEVMDYRAKVRAAVLNVIREQPVSLPIGWDSPFWPVIMGIEHERIHLETSSVLIRQQSLDLVTPQPAWAPIRTTGEPPENALITVPQGEVTLGKPFDDPWYGWDNEYGHHRADVEEFKASQFLVSNSEFLEFVEAGGYLTDAYWSEEGLGWRNFAKASHPTFWVWKNEWFLRLMTEEVEMPWDWPVEVNFHEAKAFCNWKSQQTGQPVRMPTEDEWHRLAEEAGVSELESDQPANANLHLDHGASSCPVTRFQHGQWFDVVGNVWQWVETPTYPFPGFDVHPLYDDFTTPTFDNQHNLIKGGSWISCGNETRLSARYAFRRHFFQHAGFRYVVSDAEVTLPSAYYESNARMAEYAEFHYGDEWFGVANFPQALANKALAAMAGRDKKRALDLGCASGRGSFELAREFAHVDGVDFSANFIRQGVEMAEQQVLRYTRTEEGELISYQERTLASMGLETVADRVSFHQGDACNLKPQFSEYDLVLAANLIDRLYKPAQFLETIHQRINAGGILMIASPYTWLEEYTPMEEWIGGFKKNGENFSTLDGLKELLEPHFKMISEPEKVPFVIRETMHKYQHSLSEVTLWERRS
ncbi:5-histidylcysteine sulfoxide synthase [Halomonas sp. ISL-60]|uniref:5-histidylcysteine sulfoxide synthase n=1 Tax=Halomonas sp. ISL-56 TaxID=2819149 RepID=UPI001BEAFB86|nr:5-histidylcysteine sulfoxide synthase [Halomonas sp. ISL-56]MBT2772229.1 5-histidylcysteine sulfoxide synthase [Halomonas sp. ISL-60]MBT2803012.1 5-histidylcysteine sulfoxide synthase [Halomonas sp. ISL-56]